MGIVLMAATIGGVAIAVILLVYAFYTRTIWLRDFVLGGTAVWFTFYFAMLIGSSVRSEEKELRLNEARAFCGFYLDCHMHTTVTAVRTARTIGNKAANDKFYIVTVKVFSNAKEATLGFGGLKLHVTDADGRLYPHSPEVEPDEPWFNRPVPAGGSFERDVVFDLPTDVRDPRLDMHDDQSLIEKFLIGDEDSMFHKGTYFKLDSSIQTVRVQE
jgi:hypothetical protein